MVSPKVVKSTNNGDKLSCSKTFKEPEGMVSIDLNSAKNKNDVSADPKFKNSKKVIVIEIIVALFILNITVFGVLIVYNQGTNTLKPNEDNEIQIVQTSNFKYINDADIKDLIKQCSTKYPAKFCCLIYSNGDFPNFCHEQKLFPDIDIRKRREIKKPISFPTLNSYQYPPLPHVEPLNPYQYIYYQDNHDIDYENPSEDFVYYPEYYEIPQTPPPKHPSDSYRASKLKDEKKVVGKTEAEHLKKDVDKTEAEHLKKDVDKIEPELDVDKTEPEHLKKDVDKTKPEHLKKDVDKIEPELDVDKTEPEHLKKDVDKTKPEHLKKDVDKTKPEHLKKDVDKIEPEHLKKDVDKIEAELDLDKTEPEHIKKDVDKIEPENLKKDVDKIELELDMDKTEPEHLKKDVYKIEQEHIKKDLSADVHKRKNVHDDREIPSPPSPSRSPSSELKTMDIYDNKSSSTGKLSKQQVLNQKANTSTTGSSTNQKSSVMSKENEENMKAGNNDDTKPNQKGDQLRNRANIIINSRNREKNEIPLATVEMQSSQHSMYNPCFMGMNQYNSPYKLVPTENNQLFQIVSSSVPKFSTYVVNPQVYPYIQSPFVVTQPMVPSSNHGAIQVNGPEGQYYICNPISSPATNAGSVNIANMPGVEIRRDAANLQELLGSVLQLKSRSRSSATDLVCPLGHVACSDNRKCIPKHQFCDNEVHCIDGSDEITCSCKERVGKLRICDGYFDCPNGEDELGCFGCDDDEFSCDDWSKFRKSTCIPIEHRCDNIRQCEITGKDEEDCTVLTDHIGEQPFNKISNSAGFLHRNFKGKWYPTCFGSEVWAMDVCKVESGPLTVFPRTQMAVNNDNYDGPFVNILPNKEISLVNVCIQDRAAFVECPALYCGMRLSSKNPYRKQEVDISAEQMLSDLERVSKSGKQFDKEESILGDSRVVGGIPSQPTSWPWLVSIYRNGIFHCGGVLIHESWIITAAHCTDKFWLYYYEIQAGILRRFSYAPMEQYRWTSVVITNENYNRRSLKNDIALMKLSSPVRFNRYVRPICLPSELTAGREFFTGPPPGTICTTVGWGATMEHGSDPDHMREVEVPILEHCKHRDDLGEEEICAGLSIGGKDACQGDSGGPLMCRNPNNPSQWYLAGIVSHGEGCARPDEPGVYTKVSKYVGWISENIGAEKFITRFPLQHCPGFVCSGSKKCLPKKHHCDKIVDCLFGDDETDCSTSLLDLFKHARQSNNEDDNEIDSIGNFEREIENNNSTVDEYFVCKSLLQLVTVNKRCNKIVDCEDGTDEFNCTCADYVKSQNPKAICDGISDCFDLSDEQCVKCTKEEFYCRLSQQCIQLNKRCNRKPDCSKGEDEWDCVALTNGRTIAFDADSRPNLTMSGLITVNSNGVWRPYCLNSTVKVANIATNTCYILGFEEYQTYHEYQLENKPLVKEPKKNETVDENSVCDGLYVRCSNVSLDSSVHSIRDKVIDEVELYTAPWNAVIYSDGIYRCMGAILNSMWIVTSVDCYQHITDLKTHYVAVLLGKGKAELPVKGPHEQTLRIVESKKVPNADIVLLRTEKTIIYSRYVKHLRLNLRRDGQRKEKCVAIGLFDNKAKYEFLSPIRNCEVGYRCFEVKIKTDCKSSGPWSGTIVCDSGSGWYSAAVYFEKNGLCGLSSVEKYTSVPYHKKEIINIIEQVSLDIDAPECDGFRCSLGECINKTKTCNGIPDCRGAEDENSSLCYENEHLCHLTGICHCDFNELRCKNGKCISKSQFCDRNDDCGDASDEPNVCDCKSFLELTNPEKICDGILNCMDRSDEDPLVCTCRSDGFNCSNSNLCVPNDMVCDGFEDCPKGDDEKYCFNIVTEHNETTNAGELISRTGGVWHSGCFHNNYTTEEMQAMCQDLGFFGGTSDQLLPPKNVTNIKTLKAKIDDFKIIWLRRNLNRKFRIGLRTGNEPYVHFIPDDDCYKLFLACL